MCCEIRAEIFREFLCAGPKPTSRDRWESVPNRDTRRIAPVEADGLGSTRSLIGRVGLIGRTGLIGRVGKVRNC